VWFVQDFFYDVFFDLYSKLEWKDVFFSILAFCCESDCNKTNQDGGKQ